MSAPLSTKSCPAPTRCVAAAPMQKLASARSSHVGCRNDSRQRSWSSGASQSCASMSETVRTCSPWARHLLVVANWGRAAPRRGSQSRTPAGLKLTDETKFNLCLD